MTTPTTYQLTPVSEKPEKEGWYFVIDPDSDEGINCCEYDPVIKKWYNPVANEAYPSHWLRPVAVPEEKGEREMISKITQAFNAGVQLVETDGNSPDLAATIKHLTGQSLPSSTPATPQSQQGGWVKEAAQDLIDSSFWQYKAGNGRMMSIEDTSGEKCMIVPAEKLERLKAAIEELPSDMMTLDKFAAYFDKSPVFILRLKGLYVYLGHGGIDKGEWAEYNEKARRLVDSLMAKLLPNPQPEIK